MESQLVLVAIGFFVVGGGLGLVLGRRSAGDGSRVGELEQQLVSVRHEVESLTKERELALSEIAAAREELERSEARFEGFQTDVVDHFSGTSDLVRDLTLQYRSVISHLTDGVGKLCPEGSLEIAERMRLAALPSEAEGADATGSDEGVIETSAVASETLEGAPDDADASDDGAERPASA